MLRLITYSLVLMIGLPHANAWAAMYKHVDEKGNITYTDKPDKQKEKEFIAPEISTVETVKPPDPDVAYPRRNKAGVQVPKPQKLTIISPANDSVIRDNSGAVTISFSIEPASKEGHQLFIQLDGAKFIAVSGNKYTFKNMDRGTHKVMAIIRDTAGKKLAQSKTITFHLKRHAGG